MINKFKYILTQITVSFIHKNHGHENGQIMNRKDSVDLKWKKIGQ